VEIIRFGGVFECNDERVAGLLIPVPRRRGGLSFSAPGEPL
jgi:hypothetical protein